MRIILTKMIIELIKKKAEFFKKIDTPKKIIDFTKS